ncbi:hypothetical protein ABIB85_007923 [Bradyrhizobium sp. JR1.5]
MPGEYRVADLRLPHVLLSGKEMRIRRAYPAVMHHPDQTQSVGQSNIFLLPVRDVAQRLSKVAAEDLAHSAGYVTHYFAYRKRAAQLRR